MSTWLTFSASEALPKMAVVVVPFVLVSLLFALFCERKAEVNKHPLVISIRESHMMRVKVILILWTLISVIEVALDRPPL